MASKDKRDLAWLCEAVSNLFDQARQAEEPDHLACSKYAELLAKVLLPRVLASAGISTTEDELEQVRQKALQSIRENLPRAL